LSRTPARCQGRRGEAEVCWLLPDSPELPACGSRAWLRGDGGVGEAAAWAGCSHQAPLHLL